MKFPTIPKNIKWILYGLVIVAIVANPAVLRNSGSQESLLKRVAMLIPVVAVYFLFGEKYGLIAAIVVAVFLWLQTREGMEMEGKAIEGTQCPPTFEFDVGAQMCKNKDTGALVKPTQVVCASGYKPNETNDKCIQDAPPDSPMPPPPAKPADVEPPASSTGSKSAETAAPAKTTEKFEEGKGTIATTPGEAQEKAKGTVVLQKQESIESFVDWNQTGYPLQ
jgi:hypothetical protein